MVDRPFKTPNCDNERDLSTMTAFLLYISLSMPREMELRSEMSLLLVTDDLSSDLLYIGMIV